MARLPRPATITVSSMSSRFPATLAAVAAAAVVFAAAALPAGAVPVVGPELTPDVATTPLDQLIRMVINWILGFLGFIAVIFIIYAGIQTVINSNDAGKAEENLQTIKWAIIGLVIVIISWAVVNFVLSFFQSL